MDSHGQRCGGRVHQRARRAHLIVIQVEAADAVGALHQDDPVHERLARLQARALAQPRLTSHVVLAGVRIRMLVAAQAVREA